MTDAPSPPWLADAPPRLQPPLADGLCGGLSPAGTLARMLLTGAEPGGLVPMLEGLRRRARPAPDGTPENDHRAFLSTLLALARRHRDGLGRLHAMVRVLEEETPSLPTEDTGIAACRARFDRLVAISPEASVAACSLGDRRLLDTATAEILAVLRAWGLIGPNRHVHVLDLGCGIGRVTAALAPEVAAVVGIDISAGMIAEARRRCAGRTNIALCLGAGDGLSAFADAAFDLVLAVDSFPYLVEAAPALTLADHHIAEAARVLRPAGDLLILNFSYRGDADADRRDIARAAARAGFAVLRDGTQPFTLWDGTAFHLRRTTFPPQSPLFHT